MRGVEILPNGIAVIEGDTHFAQWVREHDSIVTDPWFVGILGSVIEQWNVTRIIDAGANIGTLTVPMCRPGCVMWAIEPNPKAAECLRINTQWLPVNIIQAGVSDTPGEMFLEENPNAGASRLSFCETTIACPVITIDSLGFSPQLIKADVEGMELCMLRGAKETITRCRPVLVLEVNEGALAAQGHNREMLFDWLSNAGYGWRIAQPDCKVSDPQYDVVAFPV